MTLSNGTALTGLNGIGRQSKVERMFLFGKEIANKQQFHFAAEQNKRVIFVAIASHLLETRRHDVLIDHVGSAYALRKPDGNKSNRAE